MAQGWTKFDLCQLAKFRPRRIDVIVIESMMSREKMGRGMIRKDPHRRRLTHLIARGGVLAAAGILALTLAPASAGADVATARPPAAVYIITFSSDSVLYRLDPRTHKVTSEGPTGVELTDITFKGKTLYAIGFADLYRLNAATGTSQEIGSLGFNSANALVTQPNTGTLYGADEQGDFFTINSGTGQTTLVGAFGNGLGSAGDLTFANGKLYAAVTEPGSSTSFLAVVNVKTGVARVIGNTGYANVWGLVTGNGSLYGATYGGSFLAISAATGRVRVIWQEGVAAGGMAAP
jgi:hypothetical protein